MAAFAESTRPIHVLVVEDEPLISDWVTEVLVEQGFIVSAVTNAADALQHLSSAPVDVLFTDVNLPGGMDGMVLADRARQLLPHLPVVYASGHANLLHSPVRVPGSFFVAKPYIPALVGRLLADTVKASAERLPA